MKDKKFQSTLKLVRVELHKRMGKKMCSELNADCWDCKTRYLIGLLNSWIGILEPFKKTNKNK